MTLRIKVPAQITVDAQLIDNQPIINVRNDGLTVSLYIQVEESTDNKLVEGPIAISGYINKERPDAYKLLKAKIVEEAKKYLGTVAERQNLKTTMLSALADDLEIEANQ